MGLDPSEAAAIAQDYFRTADALTRLGWGISGYVYAIYHALAQHDIYYMDFRPSNVNLQGLPGLQEYDPSTSDEF